MIEWYFLKVLIKNNNKLNYFIFFFILCFGFRLILIIQHPEIYSWDAFRRIWNHDYILVRHWLPFFQLILSLFLRVIPSLFCLKIFMGCISGLTCGSAYLLGQQLFNQQTGIIWATLLAFSPLFVRFSIVPYQEALFLFLIFMGIYFYLLNKPSSIYLSSLFISLSCLTRYEGWILCGIIIADILINKRNKYNKKECYVFVLCFIVGIFIWLCVKFLFQVEPVIGSPLHNTDFINDKMRTFQNLSTIMAHFLLKIKISMYYIKVFIGLPFVFIMCLGMVFIVKDKYDFKMQLITYTVTLLALSIIRSFGGVFTDRMMLFPISFLLIPIAIALSKFWNFANRFRPNFKNGMIIMLLIVFWYAPKAVISVRQISSSFAPEYGIAKLLENLNPKSKTLIYPRPSNNIWGESLISAVIGNSIKLKINHNIFSFDMLPKRFKEDINIFIKEKNIDYIVSFHNGKYRLTKSI